MPKQWTVNSSVELKRYTYRKVKQTGTAYPYELKETATEQIVTRVGKVLVTIDLDHILEYYAASALRHATKKSQALGGWVTASVISATDTGGPVQRIPLREGFELIKAHRDLAASHPNEKEA